MKHIKFTDNIEGDPSYSNAGNRLNDGNLLNKIADSEYDDNFTPTNTVKWYSNLPEEPSDFKPLDFDKIEALKNEANSILHGESLAYETKMNKTGSSDQKWARTLLSKGAMADRVAAATVLIQDSPIHNLSILRNLVSMVKPAKKKDGLTVIETLSELFLADLLLADAKLRPFENRSLSEIDKMCSGNRDHRRKILKYWIFEDQLKEIYGEFIKALNTFAHDTVDAHKEKAISSMSKLLMHNPEQEKVLLCNVINKLGDPSQKVASKVIYHLCQVLYNHPNMKKVVLDEIEKMLFRPNISPKAQYYGVCFLNQFYLSKDDLKVAEDLVRVYFSFFKACIKKGDIDSRLMSAILTGVKRCQPFLNQQKMEEIQTQSDALHKLVHLARYNISIHALALLFQISPLSTQMSDRYYQALYKKLADPETLITTLPALMMNLVYRSIKADNCESRVLAFLKRLLQLASMSDAHRACAFLLLIARLARTKKIQLKLLIDPITQNNQESNDNLQNSDNKNNETSNLNPDDSVNGVIDNEANEISNDITKNKSLNKKDKSLFIGDKMDLLNDDDDEEVYHDIPLEEDEEDHKKKLKRIKTNKKSGLGWIHVPHIKDEPEVKVEEPDDNVNNDTGNLDPEKEKQLKILLKKSKNLEKVITEYNPLVRNPAYCGAEHSIFGELSQLLNHFHPSVRLFAEKISKGAFIQYNGDPLIDFSIARFLDRFAFKNPKKDPVKLGENEVDQHIKAIKGSHPKFAQRRNYLAGGIRSLPVNSSAYLNENSEYIPVDERYLYDYLQLRKSKSEDDEEAESDNDSVNSEDFESYLDGLIGKPKNDDSDDDEDPLVEKEYLDYMKEMMDSKNKTKESKKNKSDDEDDDEEVDNEASDVSVSDNEEDDDIENENGLSMDDDSELDFSDDEDEKPEKTKSKKNKDPENESDFEFSDEDDDTFDVPVMSKSTKKGKKGGIESMFASAEEFATLLEETGADKGQGTSHAVSNTENAHMKQLSWETKRDRWVKGYNNKKSKPFKTNKFQNKSTGNFKNNRNFKANNFQGGQKRKFSDNKSAKAKKAKY